jgi:hypothetical protein
MTKSCYTVVVESLKKIGVTWNGLDKMEIIKPSLHISESDNGKYCLQCGMRPEDKSLMYTEIGVSQVARTIKQQEEYSRLGSTALSRVSRLSQYLQCMTLI